MSIHLPQISNFHLPAKKNTRVSLDELRSTEVIMTSKYTQYPAACPIVAKNFHQAQNQMNDAITLEHLNLKLITTRPAQDLPSRLKSHTQTLGGDWQFISGEMETMQEIWDSDDIYGEIIDRTEEIVIFHGYNTYLIDQECYIRYVFTEVWNSDDITHDIQNLINQGERYE